MGIAGLDVDGLPTELVGFVRWVLAASPVEQLQVLSCLELAREVYDEKRLVCGVPDFWAGVMAFSSLSAFAEMYGFPDAARFCDQEAEHCNMNFMGVCMAVAGALKRQGR